MLIQRISGKPEALLWCVGCATLLGFGLIVASPLEGLAQTVDSGRIEEQLPAPTPPPTTPDIQVSPQEDLTPPPGAERKTFELKSLSIEGSTVYSAERLQAIYAPLLAQSVSLKDLYTIASQITQLYRRDGYVLSFAVVPEQTISDGKARIQVIEGYVEKVDFEGVSGALLKRVQGYGEKIMASRPLKAKDLERYLLLADDLAGIQVRAILRRGSQLGTAGLLVRVIHDPIDVVGNLSNRGTEAVGPLRLQAGLSLNSLMGQGEQLTLRGATALEDPNELAFGSARLLLPIGNEGITLNLGGSYTEVHPGGNLQGFSFAGRTYTAEAGVSYPVVRSRNTTIVVNGGFDYADSRNVFNFSGTSLPLAQDRLQVLRVGVQAENRDASGIFQASAQLSQGIGGTRSGTAREPLSRPEASAIFTKANLSLTRIQRLPEKFTLLLTSKAQLTQDTLLVREMFGLGGESFGSAFDPDALLGDYGYAFRVELQRPISYEAFGMAMSTQPYIFADYGQVFRISPLTTEHDSDVLSSAGFGFRHNFGSLVYVGLELAFPIERTDRPVRSDPKVFFTVSGFF